MRKFLLFTAMCILGLYANAQDLRIVEVGADKNPDASNLHVPAYDYAYYSMSQQIYTAEDLGGNTGAIYTIAFKDGNDTYIQTRTYEVYLTPTELSAFDGNNYKLPKNIVPAELTLEECLDIISKQQDGGKAPAKRRYTKKK